MDSVQSTGLGLLCAITIGFTAGSLSVNSSFHERKQPEHEHKLFAAEQTRYSLPRFESSSQSIQKIAVTSKAQSVELDSFFDGFGRSLEASQTSLSYEEQRLIWDNLEDLLS